MKRVEIGQLNEGDIFIHPDLARPCAIVEKDNVLVCIRFLDADATKDVGYLYEPYLSVEAKVTLDDAAVMQALTFSKTLRADHERKVVACESLEAGDKFIHPTLARPCAVLEKNGPFIRFKFLDRENVVDKQLEYWPYLQRGQNVIVDLTDKQ